MKSSRIVTLAMFAMVVFCGLETALANPTYSFTTIDVPGAIGITAASGINDSGQIVGYFQDAYYPHGFLDTGGSLTIIDYDPEGFVTEALGINNNGQIVGVTAYDFWWSAFVYTSGNFTVLLHDIGCNMDITFSGINNSGQIVGYTDCAAFVYTGGNFTTINIPGASTGSQALGINDSGQIVGGFLDGPGKRHGFVDTAGTFTTLDVPGATDTSASGINSSGQIVGTFTDATGRHGFVYTGGNFTTLDVPGATKTSASGINNSGQIVGTFTDATGVQHGFLASPVSPVPEPLVVGVGDFNGDGYADLLWFNANTGALVEWLLDGRGNVIATPSLSMTCGSGCSPQWQVVGVGDFNGDGHADVLWFNANTGALGEWLLDGRGNVIATPSLSSTCGSGCSPPWQVVGVGDFNGDGYADVLWFNAGTGQLTEWLLDGQGNVIATPILSRTCGSGCSPQWQAVGVGDFNGDGHADVLWFNASTGQLSEWLLDGQGNVMATPILSVTCGPGCSPPWQVVGVGDFNGDRHADVLWFNASTGQLSEWLLDGQGNVIATPVLSRTCGSGCSP